ncbi:MAG: hypothetical protein JW969_06185 [Spirochaetales bacterium]|nr:hypothetical protein [Spirochaetales bacterium]
MINKEIIVQLDNNTNVYRMQKERMAWAGTVLYLIFSFLVIGWFLNSGGAAGGFIKGNYPLSVCFFFAIILLYFIFIAFIQMQFKMRWIASDVSILLKRYLFNIKDDVNYYEFTNNLNPTTNDPFSYLPKIIEKKLRELNAKRNGREFILALLKILLIYGIFSKLVDSRLKAEILAYISITVIFAVKILVYLFFFWL